MKNVNSLHPRVLAALALILVLSVPALILAIALGATVPTKVGTAIVLAAAVALRTSFNHHARKT